jgi:Holliday junction resolvase-like predicted endonuclease
LQSKILKWLRSNGHYAEKIILASRRGTADIISCVNGYYVAIEVKSPGKQLTDLQQYRQRCVQEAGGIYIVAHTLEDVQQTIKELNGRRTREDSIRLS